MGTSQVVQLLRIHLPMQETQVPSLVVELYPACYGEANPTCHCIPHATEQLSLSVTTRHLCSQK